MGYQLLPPSWSRYGNVSFFLGTDDLGRDMLIEVARGMGPSLFIGALATLTALAIGVPAGLVIGTRIWTPIAEHAHVVVRRHRRHDARRPVRIARGAFAFACDAFAFADGGAFAFASAAFAFAFGTSRSNSIQSTRLTNRI